jgi:hypothetical protein
MPRSVPNETGGSSIQPPACTDRPGGTHRPRGWFFMIPGRRGCYHTPNGPQSWNTSARSINDTVVEIPADGRRQVLVVFQLSVRPDGY